MISWLLGNNVTIKITIKLSLPLLNTARKCNIHLNHEKLESLAVAWAMEKFHLFLYRNKFVLETDQKPLEVILLKSLNQATPMLQCILIRTFPYHFKVRYTPCLTNHVADCLTRLGFQKDTISLLKLHVNQITSQLKAISNNLHNL